MAPIGKIYTYPNNPRVFKALIAAKYSKVEVEEVHVAMGKDNKTPEFLEKFPLGKVPAFEGTDKCVLYESSAIAYYIASYKDGGELVGKNKQEIAQIQQFLSLADNELFLPALWWIYPILGYYPLDDKNTASAKDRLKSLLTALDKHLLTRTFFVGERVTLADIVLVCSLYSFYKMVLEPSFRAPFKNLNRWFTTCVNQPEFKAVLGEVALCEKMAVAEAAKPAPKAAAPKAAAKPKKDADEEEEPSYADEKPKEKNPLDLLPKSSMVLDEWKRVYSNNDTRPTAVDWFWANFDPQGYSIYKVDYKYNSELAMVFMSSNLVGGFFQRLESSRKYAFGSLVILGEDGNNQITGYFVFRGQGIPFEVSDCPDFESYDFVKVDHTDSAVRAEFEAVLAWDETINGKKCADGKIFK
ncbi:hypothetical protein BATDEDRAFT_37118 [Batrachochytrium dendrobatidis JAM81]|uniref:Elongation factor 1-gamma n=2 Tax=Batrachochytrium dendrobatidis TaxID=109871 RepID=F4P5W5_BATDJ|nr:uncharacterized protein BATDEDRAFT_37118 [Batrachochytrium dendrobatidis JAM81]EGF79252.1 hypothetical protein BATDEDRAFT_37118 [Batrachochytrium dendrobatidis JAM81]KAK5665832.1 hypothetical protein QVD99_007460 [Batrachochytrium dendrobatidis]OAJ42770.1 hypothetical protein BDEG_26184 [Batrachochytrium dendrobatidis JEL423]|eukprot:XP_006680023.1 hypothetical protein BATDEDRAFT_37118 [Batrachochytrium dendrobatidis JAM81]